MTRFAIALIFALFVLPSRADIYAILYAGFGIAGNGANGGIVDPDPGTIVVLQLINGGGDGLDYSLPGKVFFDLNGNPFVAGNDTLIGILESVVSENPASDYSDWAAQISGLISAPWTADVYVRVSGVLGGDWVWESGPISFADIDTSGPQALPQNFMFDGGVGGAADGSVVVEGGLHTIDLQVVSVYGPVTPPVGSHIYTGNSINVTCTASAYAEDGELRYRCSGWTGTGDVPSTGSTNNTGEIFLAQDSSITWQWDLSDYWLDVEIAGGGDLNVTDGWQPQGTNLQVLAIPDSGWLFMGWSGDLSGDYTATNTTLLMDDVKNVLATFSLDADEDGLLNDQEFSLGTDPRDSDSDDDGLSDGEEFLTYGTNPLDSDTDDDGLSDEAEINIHGTDPLDADTDGDELSDYDELNVYSTDPLDSDSDDDGLTDGSEIHVHNTDPNDSDTDNDLISDGAEVANGLDPVTSNADIDSDSDGLFDAAEVNTHGTDPLDDDSDDDNLTDGDEVGLYGTNPLDDDTDNDLIRDDLELANGLDPLISNAGVDSDSDNLSDAAEVNTYGTNPLSNDTDSDMLLDFAEIFTYGTNPTKSDTDDDGLSDHTEIFGTLTSPFDSDTDDDGLLDGDEINLHGTDPKDPDSDDDGLNDGLEISFGSDPHDTDSDNDGLSDGEEVNIYSTNPMDADTDGDGASDGDEVNIFGTDPADPDDDADWDDDGIVDAWEDENFGSAENCDPNDDPDNDLYTNIEEFRNGTDPNTPDVYLESYTAIELVWRMMPGTNYQIQVSTSLSSNNWENVGGVITGDGTTNAVFDTTRDAEAKYYRVIMLP